MKTRAFWIALGLWCACLRTGAQADGRWTDVPQAMQGVWGREGRCDIGADRLTMTAKAAVWPDGSSQAVRYSIEDRTVYPAEEYEVDNFVAGRTADTLVYNSQGNNMPGKVGYARCGSDLARQPWPPKSTGR